MKKIKLYLSFTFLALVIISMTQCANPHCPKKDNPKPPDPTTPSNEITSWTDKSKASITDVLIREFFTDDLTGYVVGYGGVIYKTTDGFTSMTLLNSGTTQSLLGVWFTDANTGYAVGYAGTILKTTNAGASWTPLSAPTSANFTRVYFLNANTGYIIGGVGTLLKTADAGANWTILNSGTSEDLHGIYFTDDNTGYISGQVYTLMKTTNAGASWTALNTGLTGGNIVTPLLSIDFISADTGYVVGGYAYPTGTPSESIIIKTTDGGVSWVQQAHPAGFDIFNSVKFFGNVGYVAGGNIPNNTSTILKTTNGGNTWVIQSTATNRLADLFLVSSGEGYAVGLNGALLKGN
jgi:photosystem II stability/assembly factor-like uncharacterized protein